MKPSIPIAVSTGSLYPLPTLNSIQNLHELGIRDIELTLQANEFSLSFERKLSMPILPDLQSLIQSDKLCVHSVHAPMVRAEHSYNLWSRLRYLSHSIEVCALLGGHIVVIHPFHSFRTHEDALTYLANGKVSLPSSLLPGFNDILEQARSANIILALENIQDWDHELFFNTPEPMARFLSEMNHPCLRFTLDLMHAQFTETLGDFTNFLADQIVNIHASDLLPPTKRVAIGKGVIDWQRLIPKLQTLPNLRQVTVELSNPQAEELIESIKIFSALNS
jgi:sugar phosphate isomerase/epimerase